MSEVWFITAAIGCISLKIGYVNYKK